MIDKLLAYVAPHHCFGCGKSGQLLCNNCKYNIENEPFPGCVSCGGPSGTDNVCVACPFYDKAWCVTAREGAFEELLDAYKFERIRAAYRPLADMLTRVVPMLPSQTVIVPIPTVNRHIRQRGYDHMELVARRFAVQKACEYRPFLKRRVQSVQRGATKSERIQQAKEAFALTGAIVPDVPYLVVDDVVTTGATLRYAAQLLREAGAHQVWVASLSRQISTK